MTTLDQADLVWCPGTEDEQDRNVRMQREAAMLAAARLDIEAGRKVEWAETKAWLIAREQDASLPVPQPSGRRRSPA